MSIPQSSDNYSLSSLKIVETLDYQGLALIFKRNRFITQQVK